MKKRTLRKFLILLISLPIALVGIILACAGGDFFDDYYSSFFAPEVSHANNYKLLYRSANPFYGSSEFYSGVNAYDTTNITEWVGIFNSQIKRNDLEYLVYRSRIGEIDTCIFRIKDNNFPVGSLKKNTIFSFPDKVLAKEFLFYLGFAKRCEPYANYVPDWWNNDHSDDPRKKTESMQKLIDGGTKSFLNAKNNNLKQRYFFQLVRLLYQSGNYEQCISFYDQYAASFSTVNSIKYRTLGYIAGSYHKLKEFSKANYLYSIIYDRCNQMKIIAYQSFHPQEEADWEGSLQLAQNTREKTALWHLLGIYADPVRAMKKIYALDPKSDFLDLLLTRAININEENFIISAADAGHVLDASKVNPELYAFVKQVAEQKKSAKPYLWDLSAGYLCAASHDFTGSEKYLAKASTEAGNDFSVNDQVRLIRLINKIELYKNPTPKSEDNFTQELQWLKDNKDPELRSKFAYSWILTRLSEKYRSFGDLLKAQCLDYTKDMSFYDDPAKMKALIGLMDKPAKTGFEKFILAVHPYSRADIFDYQSTNLVFQHQLKDALAKFKECDRSGEGLFIGDPFLIHINDCHDCDHQAAKKVAYSKRSFVEQMLVFEEETSHKPKEAAEAYFLLGNGYYNITYFGNGRTFYENPIKPSVVMWEFSSSYANFKDIIYDCSMAEECYRKAMELAIDPEFKAKCCFMAAKCEQNRYFISGNKDKADFRAGDYFKMLKDKYAKTDYYKDVINECGYFKTYAGRK